MPFSVPTAYLKVLVVDDDPLLRLDLADNIADAGHEVVEAADGDEALAILEADATYDVLVTDIDMPGAVDGLGLARRISRTRPGLRICVTSGRRRDVAGELPASGLFFEKPCSVSSLLGVLGSIAAPGGRSASA